jgi:hypothetical protein
LARNAHYVRKGDVVMLTDADGNPLPDCSATVLPGDVEEWIVRKLLRRHKPKKPNLGGSFIPRLAEHEGHERLVIDLGSAPRNGAS